MTVPSDERLSGAAAYDIDTVAAVATAPGEGAIAIVRLAGPASLAIADRVFAGGAQRPSRCADGRFLRGHVRRQAPQGEAQELDEAVLLVFRAPRSYTRDDVVEIQCHGGRVSARRILQAVLEAGARLAEPGEFTRRAFLNGRLDLLQAEAVADMIRAQSERAAAAALEQLQGRSSAELASIYDELLSAAADIEAALDFDEDDDTGATAAAAAGRRMECQRQRLARLRRRVREGRLLREGVLSVILGRPNAGKSTLLNTLLGQERAIVSEMPGTTRDTIEETWVLDGYPVRLMDTAGLRDAGCRIEQEGVDRARDAMRRADLILYVLDASCPLPEDYAMLRELAPAKTVVVANKTDLGARLADADTHPHLPIRVSLLRACGLDRLREALRSKLAEQAGSDLNAATAERHAVLLRTAADELDAAQGCLQTGREDRLAPAARHIREAMTALGEMTGQTYSADVLDRIFSRFCIGK